MLRIFGIHALYGVRCSKRISDMPSNNNNFMSCKCRMHTLTSHTRTDTHGDGDEVFIKRKKHLTTSTMGTGAHCASESVTIVRQHTKWKCQAKSPPTFEFNRPCVRDPVVLGLHCLEMSFHAVTGSGGINSIYSMVANWIESHSAPCVLLSFTKLHFNCEPKGKRETSDRIFQRQADRTLNCDDSDVSVPIGTESYLFSQ